MRRRAIDEWTGLAAVVAALALGCNGLILDPAGDDEGADGERDFTPAGERGSGHPDADDGMRRLTNREYENTVAALFGPVPHRSTLAPDTRSHGYDRVMEGTTVSPAHVDGYAATARSIANAVIEDDAALGRWLPCDVSELPSRTRPRVSVQQGGDLVCSYNANCYRPDDDVSFPNSRSDGSAPGYLYYDETIPTPGRYRVTIRAHLGGTYGDAVLALTHGELGVLGTFSPDGDVYRDHHIELDVDTAGVLPLTLEWQSPRLEPRRRVHIDTITLTGPIDSGEGSLNGEEQRACGEGLIDALGPRAFRRPLEPGERDLLVETFAAGAADGFWDGLRMVLELLLQAPQLLYVVEVGTPVAEVPGYYRLDAFELATRLSLLAWQAPPDDALWDAATSGRLDTEEGIRGEAERLLSDPRARETVRRFYTQWLELDEVLHAERSPVLFPELTAAMRQAMLAETERFLDDAIWERGAGLDEVLTAEHTFVTDELAGLYGMEAAGDGLAAVDLPPERRGLLTQASLLMARSQSNQTSPVQRGAFVLERLLCVELPLPPEDLEVVPPSLDEDGAEPRTTRERWAQHSSDPACRGCHSQIDPVGFTFESFDPIGRFRTEEAGRPVDTTGGIPSIDVPDGSLGDATDLAAALAESPRAADCLTRQWMRFGLGRLERDTDAGDVEQLAGTLQEEGIRAMLLALVDTAAFRHRIVEDEVSR